MKTFKQYVTPTVSANESAMSTLQGVGDAMAQKLLDLKAYKPTSETGKFVKSAITGEGETTLGQIGATLWELIDPTGISSYDDAVEAYVKFRTNPNVWHQGLWILSLFCCIPNLGLIAGAGVGGAAGAAGAGVGAIPGAVGGGIVGGGAWISVKAGLKGLLKRAAKNPEKTAKEIEAAVESVSKFVRKVPGGPEAMVEAAEKTATATGKTATKTEIDTIKKVFGEGTGVKVEGTPKPKEISKAEYDALPSEKKAELHKAYAAKAEDLMASKFKFKGDKTNSPAFTELYDQQKYFLGERLARKGEDINKLSPEEVRKKVIEYIVDNPNDALIEKGLKEVAKEVGSGASIETVINGVKKTFPDYKYYEPKTVEKALEPLEDLGKITGKKADDGVTATKEADKAATKEADKAATKEADKAATKEADKAEIPSTGKSSAIKRVATTYLTGKKLAKLRAVSNLAQAIEYYCIKALNTFGSIFSQGGPYGAMGASGDEIVDFTTSDGKKIKTTRQALKDVGLTPLQAPEPTVYTFGGKVLTPAQAAALGSFATPTRFNSQTQKWEEIKNIVRPGQQIMNPDGSTPDEVNATPAVPYDKNSRFNELGDTPEIGARGEEQSLKTGRIVTQNIPQGATAKNPLGREGMTAGEYTKPDKFNNPPTVTFDDIIKSIFGP